jgi:hypothetical protein
MYHGTRAHLNGVLHKSFQPVCVSLCVSPYHYEAWHMYNGTRARLKGVLHRSFPPVCKSVCVSPYHYEAWHKYHGTRARLNGVLHRYFPPVCVNLLIITKLGTCIMAPELISTACFIILSHQSVCLCVSPYHYEVCHMYHSTPALLKGVLHNSFPPVCVSLCVSPYHYEASRMYHCTRPHLNVVLPKTFLPV